MGLLDKVDLGVVANMTIKFKVFVSIAQYKKKKIANMVKFKFCFQSLLVIGYITVRSLFIRDRVGVCNR